MYYIYFLRSQTNPNKTYIGITTNLKCRIKQHNAPGSMRRYTKQYQPWQLLGFIGLLSKETALKLERYFKSGSGWEFAKRHFFT